MSQNRQPIYIQPDARGRIQLPKELRKYHLFKFQEEQGRYALTPLHVVEKSAGQSSKLVWLTPEVNQFLEETIYPKLRDFLTQASYPNLAAAFLYGSRARGDALSQSDFDFGLLVKSYPSFEERNALAEILQAQLSAEFGLFKKHGVSAEASFHFFSSEVKADNVPPIYYSVITDARLIWQHGRTWETFTKKVSGVMKAKGVVAIDGGKKRRWKWETT